MTQESVGARGSETAEVGWNTRATDGQTRLFLIRHGETDWNLEGRYQGQADPPLNKAGLRQARSLARRLLRRGLAILYSSPLVRASTTAGIVAKLLAVPVSMDARLMEINLGRWQGRLATDIERDDSDLFRRWHSEPWSVVPPGGESLAQVQERVYSATSEILARHQGETVGIVSHRIPFLLLGMRYLGFPRDAVGTVRIANASFEEILIPEHGSPTPVRRRRRASIHSMETNSLIP